MGFVVIGSHSVYFSGDTRWTPALRAALAPFPLDVALVQAACAHYPLFDDDGMSLPEAAAAIRTGWAREGPPVDLRLRPEGKPVPPDRILPPLWGIRTVNIS